jgi:F420-non-reducing hydrogenase iron-sulfur subunit
MKIIGFLCNWCSYAGADLAGVSRFKYPADIRVLRVMCTGRIDPYFVLRAFEEGADGVLISGCHIGDCHYIDGNVNAVERMDRLKETLPMLGIDPRRFRFEFVSASEGRKFQRIVTEFTEEIEKLGEEPGKKNASKNEKEEAKV